MKQERNNNNRNPTHVQCDSYLIYLFFSNDTIS